MSRKITLGLVQMAMTSEPEQNISKALSLVAVAAKKGAQIVCLPELFASPYFCIVEKAERDYSVPLSGELVERLASCARDNKVVLVAGSLYEKSGTDKFNSALVFDADGSELGKYRKVHIPHDEGFFEKNYFKPGDLGFKVFETSLCKIGVLICFDQWFPEAARAMALQGVDLVFYPTAIGTVDGIPQTEGNWQTAWETVQRGHAIANNIVVAAVNRVGKEDRSTFWGGSFISDAFGTLVAKAGNAEEVVVGEIDLDHASLVREGWGFMRNRRPETYFNS